MMNDEKYITKEQAVESGRVSASTLRRLLRERKLRKFRRPGERRILVSSRELEEALQPKEIPAR